jgi:hypothetical protein
MQTCRICHFEIEMDDVVLTQADGRCICLACYGRATGTGLRMPKLLRRELSAALATV